MIGQDFLTRQKTKLERGYSWLGVPGMGFVIASSLQRHLPVEVSLWILYPLGVFLVWATGFIDIRFGFFSSETKQKSMLNPITKSIYTQTKRGKKHE